MVADAKLGMNGADVLAKIETFRDRSMRMADELGDQLANLNEEQQTAITQRTHAFVELASHHLAAVDQQAAQHSHSQLGERLQSLAERRAAESVRFAEQLIKKRSQAEAIDQRLKSLCERLLSERTKFEQLSKQLDVAIQEDEQLKPLVEQAILAAQRLARYEARLKQIEREAEEKLPSYEASSLFQYLLHRDFRGKRYRTRGPIRRLDAWVARLIDFSRARQRYEFLRNTPERLTAALAKRKKASEKCCDELEERRDAIKADVGIAALEKSINELESQYASALDQSEALQNDVEPLEDEWHRMENSQGRTYDEALDELVEFLSNTKTNLLKQWAQQTTAAEDDRIVAEVESLADTIRSQQTEMRRLQSQRKRLANRVRELQYVLRSCRRSEIDSPRCSFPEDFDIDQLLERYAEERVDQHELLRLLREKREFEPTAAERVADRANDALTEPTLQAVLEGLAAASREVLRRMLAPHQRRKTPL